jgi:predicted small metal-binding protein
MFHIERPAINGCSNGRLHPKSSQKASQNVNILKFEFRSENMASYKFKCSDTGMDCKFTSKAASKEDLMKNIVDHAKSAHKMNEISPDMQKKVEGAIKKSFF